MNKQLTDAISTLFQKKLGFIPSFDVDNQALTLHFASAGLDSELSDLLNQQSVDVTIKKQIKRHAIQPQLSALPEVKNVIAVASGKGGVGKSTTAISLALALQRQGASVGVLDADIYGPSCALMLGIEGQPQENETQGIPPMMGHGLQSMSIAYLLESAKAPMIWRGPMVSKALQQLFYHTQWQGLDYLIVDMPPGTGDIPLTLMQKIPLTAAVVVTTPQDLSLIDARKGVAMFEKMNIPVLGVIENMSTFVCPSCGHAEAIFGEHGGEQLAKEFELPLLATLPLNREIRHNMDAGTPDLVIDDEKFNHYYKSLALKVAGLLSKLKVDYSSKFPNIVVQRSDK